MAVIVSLVVLPHVGSRIHPVHASLLYIALGLIKGIGARILAQVIPVTCLAQVGAAGGIDTESYLRAAHYHRAAHAVGIGTIEAADFSLSVAVLLFLADLLRFIVGVSTPIIGLTGRGRTGAFLLTDLGIVGSIVVA